MEAAIAQIEEDRQERLKEMQFVEARAFQNAQRARSEAPVEAVTRRSGGGSRGTLMRPAGPHPFAMAKALGAYSDDPFFKAIQQTFLGIK